MFEDGQHQVLGADFITVQVFGLKESDLEDALCLAVQGHIGIGRLTVLHFVFGDGVLYFKFQFCKIYIHGIENTDGKIIVVLQHPQEEMFGTDVIMPES